ncbi:MAG: alpha/beta hydrolase family protein [Pirellulales bacterium]
MKSVLNHLSYLFLGLMLVAGTKLYAADVADRKMQFRAATPTDAEQWQAKSRELLFKLLNLTDLEATRKADGKDIPFDVKALSSEDKGDYTRSEIEFDSTPTRRIKAILTVPKSSEQKQFPAIVCIHGHGGNRNIVYDPKSLYTGFAADLAENGYVTISTDVGQHEVYEDGRTLMGERLWDVLRCADYLETLPQVDANRMGCAGLSLGGEMTMWLGAMDPRMKAVVSSGFLTTMEGIDNDSCCLCWKFPGLMENFQFCDIYSMIAPRALMCQNGELERAPGGFPIDVAKPEMAKIQAAYAVFDAKDKATLNIHPGGHKYVVAPARAFIDKAIK